MVLATQMGCFGRQIPIEAQIIRVADEFDAIISKRPYKTHIGVTETLKELIKEAQPMPKLIALQSIEENVKVGKLNSSVVKSLCKVVIEDTEYEISGIFEYTRFLREEIVRLEQINSYNMKMETTRSKRKKEYYKSGMELLFRDGEDFRNFKHVLEEYRAALYKKKEVINNLFREIKSIKRLRV